ncbi:MAG: FIST signal transduction protein [Myxococcota bacterium]
MWWASAISEKPRLDEALQEGVAGVRARIGGTPDLLVVFVSPQHRAAAPLIPGRLQEMFGGGLVIGSTGAGVIGGGREVERRPAISLTAARLPNARIAPFRVAPGVIPAGDPVAWHARVGVTPEQQPAFVLLADPFSCDAAGLAGTLDAAWPGAVKVGGLASGGMAPGQNALFLDGEAHDAGAVGVALWGDVVVDAVVAQGCRPVGSPARVTRCEGNVVFELDGRPAVLVLEALLYAMTDADRELFRRSPMVGLAIGEGATGRRPGDFLLRNLIGLDRKAGAIGVGWPIVEGQALQFHVRDAAASAADLDAALVRHRAEAPPTAAAGALLFSCLARGEAFFGAPDHDSDAFRRHLGDVPIGGVFCNGEIGPVRGSTYIHGYTSSFGVFRPRGWD